MNHAGYSRGNQDALVSFGLTKQAWDPEQRKLVRNHREARLAVRGDVSPEVISTAMEAMRARALEAASGQNPRIVAPAAGNVPIHVPLRFGSDIIGTGAGTIAAGPTGEFQTFLGPKMTVNAPNSRGLPSVALASRGDMPFSKITDRTHLAEVLRHLAHHDALDVADITHHPIISGDHELRQLAMSEIQKSQARKAVQKSQGVYATTGGGAGFDPRGAKPKPAGVKPTPSKFLKKK